MNRPSLVVALAGVLLGPAAAAIADDTRIAGARAAEERLLGDDEAAWLQAVLPFTRQIAVGGRVAGSLEASTAAAGVPASAMLEALRAFATSIDLGRDVRDGDHFHVRYEQAFTSSGAPIGTGRVLWAELKTAKGTVAIHRFRTRDKVERFWLANGQAATPPSINLPLEVVSISSGFGLRADPFDQPPPPPTAGKSGAMGGPLRAQPTLPPGLKPGTITGETPFWATAGLSSNAGKARPPTSTTYGRPPGTASYGNWQQSARSPRSLFMHEGVDLVAPAGTPVHAAADGIVVGAGPNGRYGNWIRIDHAGKIATVYGHLAGFAPGIETGTVVSRGDLIGFVGSTGRSTGAHLHFELLSDGKPVNPINHPETKRGVLRGPDLDRLRKQVTQAVAERDRETAAEKAATSVSR
ncbi:MAG: M23 family metallopeptidase [Reyranella sp.]|nr:M23 family metallopeptidase [Reyranella sp.]